MAAPTYSTDLTTITTAETTTGWSAVGGGGSGLSASPDLAVQGTNCVDKQITNSNKGMLFNNGSQITMGTDDHVYAWIIGSTPGLEDTLANEGKVVAIGTATNAYATFHVSGSDVSIPGSRTENCFVIRYVNTSSGSAPYRTLTGSPGANPQYFGAKLNTTGSVKGSNLGVDVIRYGTGIYVTDGETTNGRADFEGVATENDNSSNQWGVFSKVAGGYALQGRLVIGQNSSGTATACEFEDLTGASIVFVDTPHSLTDFSQVYIDHGNTVCNVEGATFTGLGTNNPGRIFFALAGTEANWKKCTFKNIERTTLRTGCTFTECIWTGCANAIRTNSGKLLNCSINNSKAVANQSAVVWNASVDTLTRLDGTAFTANPDIENHAIEFGTNTPTTITLSGVKFNDYDPLNGQNGSALHIKHTAGTFTINITNGGDTPSYRTDGATVVINNTVTAKFDNIASGSRLYIRATDTVGAVTSGDALVNEVITADPYTYNHNFEGDLSILYRIRKHSGTPYYKDVESQGVITSSGFAAFINQILDE